MRAPRIGPIYDTFCIVGEYSCSSYSDKSLVLNKEIYS